MLYKAKFGDHLLGTKIYQDGPNVNHFSKKWNKKSTFCIYTNLGMDNLIVRSKVHVSKIWIYRLRHTPFRPKHTPKCVKS